MSSNILPSQKKIRLVLLALAFASLLIYLSDTFKLNEKSQRLLVKFLNVPQQFISQILQEYQEFENEKIASLEEEIIKLQNDIYESELKIRSLENSTSYSNPIYSENSEAELHISSFDQMNFTCCNKHRIYLNNPESTMNGIFAVSHGSFAVGKTKNISNNEIEVRLLSDPEEYISIKNINGFYCIAKGSGKRRLINCNNESKAVSYSEGDTFFTTGFDGIYPQGLIVGRLVNITKADSNIFQQNLEIELFFDPFQSIDKKVILHE
tara:strand:- start:1240 stop:2037 length:798 start_codon:yes stop_codon:yes gene_type:complete